MSTKKILMGLIIISLSPFLQFCKSTKATTTAIQPKEETVVIKEGDNVRINRFVSVDAVSDLRTGMTMAEAQGKLGAKPHNVLSAQADGHYVIHYKYRLQKIEVSATDADKFAIEKQNNKQLFSPGDEDLYIVFNGAGKLEYMVTAQGGLSEKLLRDNNLLYVIKKDKEKFAMDPDKSYRQTNSNVFYPLLVCPSCGEKKEEPRSSEEKNTIRIKLEPAPKN
jgi:hypothetical protein